MVTFQMGFLTQYLYERRAKYCVFNILTERRRQLLQVAKDSYLLCSCHLYDAVALDLICIRYKHPQVWSEDICDLKHSFLSLTRQNPDAR